jgi:hypothetical protein
MKVLRDILLIIAAIFIDLMIIVFSIISYKISTAFGIVISTLAVYIIVLYIVILINFCFEGED